MEGMGLEAAWFGAGLDNNIQEVLQRDAFALGVLVFVDEVFKVGRSGVDVKVHECGLQVRRWDGAVAVIIEAVKTA